MSFPCVFPSAISVLPSFRGGGSDTASRATYLSLSEGNGPRQLGPALVRGSCVSLCLSCFVRETDFGDLDLLCAVKRLPSFQIRRVVSLL